MVPWDFGAAERRRKKELWLQAYWHELNNTDKEQAKREKYNKERYLIRSEIDGLRRKLKRRQERYDKRQNERQEKYDKTLELAILKLQVELEHDRELDFSQVGEELTTNTPKNVAANTPTIGLIVCCRRFPDPKNI